MSTGNCIRAVVWQTLWVESPSMQEHPGATEPCRHERRKLLPCSKTMLTSRGVSISSRRAQSSLLALPKLMGTCSSHTGG